MLVKSCLLSVKKDNKWQHISKFKKRAIILYTVVQKLQMVFQRQNIKTQNTNVQSKDTFLVLSFFWPTYESSCPRVESHQSLLELFIQLATKRAQGGAITCFPSFPCCSPERVLAVLLKHTQNEVQIREVGHIWRKLTSKKRSSPSWQENPIHMCVQLQRPLRGSQRASCWHWQLCVQPGPKRSSRHSVTSSKLSQHLLPVLQHPQCVNLLQSKTAKVK